MLTSTRSFCFELLVLVLIGGSNGRAADSPVMPFQVPKASVPAAAAMQPRLYIAAEKQFHALLPQIHGWKEDPELRLITESKSGEHQIRPNTAVIEGMAILYRFGPYDEKITGISRADLLNKQLLPMIRYCLATHKTGDRVTSDGKAWGDAWQSAHWAQMVGSACWLIWDDLPEDCRVGVRKLIAHEADRFVDKVPPHNLVDDTKAEENAWNSQVLSVAVVLMPDDPRCPGWEKAFQHWALSAFLRPADQKSQEVVDGKTVAEQFTGANIYDDFTLENHGFVHPDYMSTFDIKLGCTLRYALTSRKPPEALLHNVGPIYENLKWLNLLGGGIVYPNGQDWELFRDPRWTQLHISMAVFAHDPDAWQLANYALATLEKAQKRDPNGDALRDDEIQYEGARMQLFRALGNAYLTLGVADKIEDSPRERLGIRRLDSAKVILNRTPAAVHSFSWGAKTMAMCVPLRLDRMISPIPRSGIGRIVVDDDNEPLPIKTTKCEVTNDADSFAADLVVEHGNKLIRAELHIASDPQGVMTWHEKLIAQADVTTKKIATGLVGILNNQHWIYETGKRRVSFDGKETIVPALSDKKLLGQDVAEVTIDSILRIKGKQPLNVEYHAAKQVNRGRATDELFLNYMNETRSWKAGQVISEYEATISRSGE